MNTSTPPDDTPVRSGKENPPAPPATPSTEQSEHTLSFPPGASEAETTELSGPFGRYTILKRLGKGGMGQVYLAHDTQLDRLVALKIPQLESGDRQLVRERFYREAQAAANLLHPNICPVFDVGAIGEVPYLTMAYIDGEPLHHWARKPHSIQEIYFLVRKIALALHEAHRRGIIHRDLKPSNVMIDHRGEPIVMDFGLARRLHLPEEARLTMPGVIMGTPAYMAPEQIQGVEKPRPTSDVYSLGVILYELLVGRGPFVGQPLVILAQVISDDPPPPSRFRPDLDPRLDEICSRTLCRSPEQRVGSMAVFAEMLAGLSGSSTDSTVSSGIRSPTESTPFGPTLPPESAEVNPAHLPKILDLLRTLGWARAIQKIRNRAQRSDNPSTRRSYQGFLDWMTNERTELARKVEGWQALPEGKALRGWALVGQASHLVRDRDYSGAQKQLSRCLAEGDPDDPMLQATIAHTRASVLVHQGQSNPAIPFLHQALDLFGRRHFMTGRVLDTLGMAYAYKGNFPIAREFFEQSIRYKQRFDDEAGIAISYGQLGRLFLEWGHLEEAEDYFQKDLCLVQKIRSRWSEAQIYNHLGQVALARAERDLRAGKRGNSRRHLSVAGGWLDQSIRMSQENSYPVSEGFARKDRSLVYLHEGDLKSAEEQLRLATELFVANQFSEGIAKAGVVEGLILRQKQRWHEAERRFRTSLSHFEATQETTESVRTYWEIARTLRDSGTAAPLITRAYLDALNRAEASRHDPLVRGIEEELYEVDIEAYLRHVYKRVRGSGIDDDSPSLFEGANEVGTTLSIDLPGFSEFSRGMDAEAVMVTFNHLLADFADVLARHDARVLAYRGTGLLALVRESRHAERGVRAALELVAALDEFNRPRQLLELPIFYIRIGVASGDVLLGNVGTYMKMDFTALGMTLNLSGALRNYAEPGMPCISRATWELIRDRFNYHSNSPRPISAAGFGSVEVWDVIR